MWLLHIDEHEGFDMCSYTFALLSCCLQASYLLLVEYSGQDKHVSSSELMVYNALWSIPALTVVGPLLGPLQ